LGVSDWVVLGASLVVILGFSIVLTGNCLLGAQGLE
jgi:hypothetical protein